MRIEPDALRPGIQALTTLRARAARNRLARAPLAHVDVEDRLVRGRSREEALVGDDEALPGEHGARGRVERHGRPVRAAWVGWEAVDLLAVGPHLRDLVASREGDVGVPGAGE